MEIKDITPEQISRFNEIRHLLEKFNKESGMSPLPVPNISIDERMQCEWYFNTTDHVNEAEHSHSKV